ncbi:3-oxoacyl-ACP reductase FabG [Sphingomonas sp. CL5.1]|uniref:SDR family NAD(P)-dependent oxidoreductase n=1 Tax=Sphingomonas sp. CL5.1 TaxID=2653203 RepID=UPI0015820F3B|nr:3-oxoacyl-ACP reductase family protein [Sphingomonas sp. CL5.1]QKR99883.1 3-oxoacyl-ACP reductase FabG [Sphingomonas sp. CL5.1]
MKLQGKVAIVTGGSQGIGEAIAKRLAKDGATVAIVYSRNDAAADKVVSEIVAAGGNAKAVRGNCADVADIQRFVEDVGAEFGRIDILVNNAGTFRTVPVAETTEAIWDEQIDLNLKGTFFCVQAVLPWYRKQGGGKVINLSSIAGVDAFPNCPAYCASKGGVSLLTKALASELARENINVNAIAPGNVATPINAHLRGPGHEDYMAQMSNRTPTGRAFMDANDMAGAAAFLASDDAKGVHGLILLVDDGWCA